MVWTIIDIILLFISIVDYRKGNYVKTLVIMIFFFTNAFIIGGAPLIKHADWGLVLLAFTILYRGRTVFKVKDETSKFIKLFISFFCFVFIYSLIIRADSIPNIITVLRYFFIPLAYFVFYGISNKELKKVASIVIKLCVLSSILFVIQYFTHLNLVNTYVNESVWAEKYRMQVVPPYIDCALLYFLLIQKKNGICIFLIALFSFVFFVAENRTPVIVMGFQIFAYAFASKKNARKKIVTLLVCSLIAPFFYFMISSRSASNSMTVDWEFISDATGKEEYGSMASSSTFLFRVAHLAERTIYLLDNRDKLLFGVGAIHEDSPNNYLSFTVGTLAQDSHGNATKMQINTGDILWSPILLRFGIIGILLFLTFIILFIKKTYEVKDKDDIMMIAFLTSIAVIPSSFTSAGFTTTASLILCVYCFLYSKSLERNSYDS